MSEREPDRDPIRRVNRPPSNMMRRFIEEMPARNADLLKRMAKLSKVAKSGELAKGFTQGLRAVERRAGGREALAAKADSQAKRLRTVADMAGTLDDFAILDGQCMDKAEGREFDLEGFEATVREALPFNRQAAATLRPVRLFEIYLYGAERIHEGVTARLADGSPHSEITRAIWNHAIGWFATIYCETTEATWVGLIKKLNAIRAAELVAAGGRFGRAGNPRPCRVKQAGLQGLAFCPECFGRCPTGQAIRI